MLALLVLAAIVVVTQAGVSIPLLTCQIAFNATFTTTNKDPVKQCAALDAFNLCMTNVVASTTTGVPALVSQAFSYLTIAFNAYSNCNSSTLSYFGPQTDIAVEIATGVNVVTTTYQRTKIGVNDLASRLYAQTTARLTAPSSLAASLTAATATAATFSPAASASFDAVYTIPISTLSTRISTIVSTAAASHPTVTSISSSVTSAIAQLSTALAAQSTARLALSTSVSASINSVNTTLSSAVSANTADLMAILAAQSTNSPLTSINALLAAVSINVTASQTAANTQQTTLLSVTVPQQASNTMSNAVKAEATRADAACNALSASGVTISGPQILSASEFGTCTTAQQGSMYYSNNYKTIFTCNGLTFVPFIPFPTTRGFQASTILTSSQQLNLLAKVDRSATWTLCYSMTRDGTAVSSFRNQCNSIGIATITVASYGSRLMGGYSNLPWTSTSGSISYPSNDYGSWAFRFHPSNPADAIESVYQYTTSWTMTADTVGWGPCWGWNPNQSTQYTPICWNYGTMNYIYTGYYTPYYCAQDLGFYCGNLWYTYWTSGTYNPSMNQVEVYARLT